MRIAKTLKFLIASSTVFVEDLLQGHLQVMGDKQDTGKIMS